MGWPALPPFIPPILAQGNFCERESQASRLPAGLVMSAVVMHTAVMPVLDQNLAMCLV